MLNDPNVQRKQGLPTRNGPSGEIIVENVFPLNPVKKSVLLAIFMYCSFLAMLNLFGWWTPSENPGVIDGMFLASWVLMPIFGILMLIGER